MTDYRGTYCSAPFKFMVEGKDFYVHHDLLAAVSPNLYKLMNDDWSEAKGREAAFEDVSAATFERFLEWLYSSYYTIPESTKPEKPGTTSNNGVKADSTAGTLGTANVLIDDPEIEFAPAEPANDGLDGWGSAFQSNAVHARKCPKCKRSSADLAPKPDKKEDLMKAFKADVPSIVRHGVGMLSPPLNVDPEDSYEEVFLCHARMYVFADRNGIEALKTFAMNQLHHRLSKFRLFEERTSDIIALIHYAYTNTVDNNVGNTPPIRKLLSQYIAFEMDTLMTNSDFRRLISGLDKADGVDFVDDFMKMVMRRL